MPNSLEETVVAAQYCFILSKVQFSEQKNYLRITHLNAYGRELGFLFS